MDSRELTPGLVSRITFSGAETRSHQRARNVLDKVGGNQVSIKTVERVVNDIGAELAELRERPASRLPVSLVPPPPGGAPPLAVVMCDGGRMMTRQPGHGPGVHEQAWRETKNASLESMTHETYESDPQPELPECFRDAAHVAELAETAALDVKVPPSTADTDVPSSEVSAEASSAPPDGDKQDWRPKRLVRTCLSSLAPSKTFGLQMGREARRRCFYEATFRAFLGDGLPWNWSIWKKRFATFVPILDFMHAVKYLYKAACTVHETDPSAWKCYLRWAQLCWSGRVSDVLPELRVWLESHGIDPSETLDDKHPHVAVLDAHRYLTNNESRMDYADYRQKGLPVTTAPMESLVKQVNQRTKGTEMFWNDSMKGGEAILQVRAAVLSDDGRLETYLVNRPGHPYVRRSTKVKNHCVC